MLHKEQAKQICSTLSLKEKVGQITQQITGFAAYEKQGGKIIFSEELKEIAKEHGVGVISALFRADPWSQKGYGAEIEIEERAQAIREFQDYVMENSEHRIPVLIDNEASHGMQSLGSVMYPVGLCSAASWNPQLYGRMMKRIGEEIKASGNHIALVTLIDLARDPRWGRSEECLGEDAYLASQYVTNGVTGMKSAGILACAKHFFGSGDAEGGGNTVPITTSEREIREVLLPTAKAAVEAGVDIIMVAYNTLNGVPLHFSHQYLTEMLRDELGFDGIILSDGMGVYSSSTQVEVSQEKAAVLALRAGIDFFNTGDYDGKETIQLYVHKMGGTVTHRPWELLRFDKVSLKIGESYKYEFIIPIEELRDVINGEFPEQIKVRAGNSSEHIKDLKIRMEESNDV